MIINYDQPNAYGDVIVFPDWAGSDEPVPPGSIKETIIITGTNAQVTIGGTGTADQEEFYP